MYLIGKNGSRTRTPRSVGCVCYLATTAQLKMKQITMRCNAGGPPTASEAKEAHNLEMPSNRASGSYKGGSSMHDE